MRMRHRTRMLCFILLLLTAPALFGDAPEKGVITGQVKDAAGNPIAAVTVMLESDRGTKTAVADAEGRYLFALLQPGDYTVKATAGESEAVERSTRVEAGVRKVVDLTLGLETTETIAVTADAVLIDKYTVGTSATVASEVAEEITFEGRNYQSVTNMMPGVVHVGQSQNLVDHRPAVNGGKWQEHAGFVDGVDTTFSMRGGSSRIILPTSAVSEVRMESSGYGAEYGRVTGGVTGVVVKSGTNTFHGDFLYLAQNAKWRAELDNLTIEHPDKLQNNYEASLGGRIVRDKLWFFGSTADNTANRWTQTVTGALVDQGMLHEEDLLKLSAQPSPTHQFTLMGIDGLSQLVGVGTFSGDIHVPTVFDLGEDLFTFSWGWSATSSMFLELKAARHESQETRSPLEARQVDSSVNPDWPRGNDSTYQDLARGFFFNSTFSADGYGVSEFPRDQTNVSLSWFRGDHELKFGVDAQEVSWEAERNVPDRYLGRNFDPDLPGGFVTPQFKRIFLPSDGIIETKSESVGLYAQDRIGIGDHWSVMIGARLEDQQHENDIGETAAESTDFAPRLAAVYDIRGDGGLLVKGTLGRYYHQITQAIINTEFARRLNGRNAFDEFNWNPATQSYDLFRRSVIPAFDTEITAVDPYSKDEITFGVEWQFRPIWAFKARALYWEIDDLYTANNQINENGAIFRLVANVPEAERNYRGLQLELNRSFRGGWLLRTNYTLGRVKGNFFGNTITALVDDDFMEARAIIDPDTGQPFTANFRYGRGSHDQTHILNVAGAKHWNIGKHTVTLGGLYWFHTGEPWGLRPAITLAAPAGGTIRTTEYIEPRDAHSLGDTSSLNLNGNWRFPLSGRVEGSLRAEVANVTNEQKPTQVSLTTGRVTPASSSYQRTREWRFLAGVRF